MLLSPFAKGPAVAGAAVLVAAAAFTAGSINAADAGSRKPVTPSQVKKIATKVADKEIDKKAPTLAVARAGTANTANFATTTDFATSAGTAATAAKLGTTTVKTFSSEVLAGGAPVVLLTSGPLSLTASCAGGAPALVASSTAGGVLRYINVDSAGVVGHSGDNNLTTLTVTSGTGSGTGSFDYSTSAAGGTATDVSFSWRNDAGNCQFFGSYVTG
jgi:hypothetical protein